MSMIVEIEKARTRLNVTPVELAERAGIKPNLYYKIRAGSASLTKDNERALLAALAALDLDQRRTRALVRSIGQAGGHAA